MDVLERVGSSRMALEGKFPYPSALDCIRYAITELAEYDDALLRQERTGDKRNNDKAHDSRSELGQALYMLLSASLLFKHQPRKHTVKPLTPFATYTALLRELATCANYTNTHTQSAAEWSIDESYALLCVLAEEWHGWDVDDLIAETCEAFEAKHLGVQA